VLWRFDGKKPDNLGLNAQLYKWIPQNDLLDKTQGNKYKKQEGKDKIQQLKLYYTRSHSLWLESNYPYCRFCLPGNFGFPFQLTSHLKTKAFITHGGTNGIYEVIDHGIPILGIPLFADQPDNIVHMKIKGASVRLDLNTMSCTDLLNDPS
ncbi:hypothetical protein HPG69_001468, partial [Diceros bicornis minor]